MADGGVGEAMLLGAAMGGGSSALMGRDPLKGALIGGLTGGVTGGIGEALAPTSAAPAAGASSTGIASLPSSVNTAGQAFGNAGTNALTGAASDSAFNQALANANAVPPAGSFTEGMSKFASDPMASLKAHPFTAGAASLAAMRGTTPDLYTPPEYNGPLKRYNWETYRPSYAEGGITTLQTGGYDRMVGEEPQYPTNMASGGISSLGSYSDGGRMLRGPGDGMSDSIPADIAGKRPARLADGEFVVPADVVSHLGNGSTDAGAKQLYAMMDKVRQARTGRKAQGREINPRKYVPA